MSRDQSSEGLFRRFWSHVLVGDGCWEWQASLSRTGYGRTSAGPRRGLLVHRVAYEMLVGPIPTGLTIDHLCRNRSCVRPDHLEPVTQRENNLRGDTIPGLNARKTHCPQNHAYTVANTYTCKRGRRSCRTCHRENRRVGAR